MIDTTTVKHVREVLVEWTEASQHVRSASLRAGNRDVLSIAVVASGFGNTSDIPGEIRALLDLPMTIKLKRPD